MLGGWNLAKCNDTPSTSLTPILCLATIVGLWLAKSTAPPAGTRTVSSAMFHRQESGSPLSVFLYFCIAGGLYIWPPEQRLHVTRRQVSESAVSWPLMAAPKIGVSEPIWVEQFSPQPYHGSSRHKFQDSWAQFPAASGGLKEGFGRRQEARAVEIAESLAGPGSFLTILLSILRSTSRRQRSD